MHEKTIPHHIVDIPLARRVLLNFIDLEWGGHAMYGLLEVDVTAARKVIEAYEARTGESLSFTGYITFCLARAINEDKSVQAYRKGRKQLALFDDVDAGLMIERQIGGTRAPVGHVIRRANHKTFMEISQEIRLVQAQPAPQRKDIPLWLRFMMLLPGPLEKMFKAFMRMSIRRNPAAAWVAMGGTVGVTAVGMFGKSAGWGIAPTGYSLWLIIGGVARKPVFVDDRVEPRELLSLTVGFDHDIVDGAPAARFTNRFVELIESGYGLDEVQPRSALEAEPAKRRTEQVLA